MKRRNRGGSVGLFSVAAILGLAAAAWACTPSPQVQVSKIYGPAGSDLTVIGSIFPSAPVEIRWGNESGAVIGEAKGPDFSAVVAVPAGASPGLHYLYYRIADDGGERTLDPRAGAFAVFEVTPGGEKRTAGVRAVGAGLWNGFSEGSLGPASHSRQDGSGSVSSGSVMQVGLALLASGFFATLFAVIMTARRRTVFGKGGGVNAHGREIAGP